MKQRESISINISYIPVESTSKKKIEREKKRMGRNKDKNKIII